MEKKFGGGPVENGKKIWEWVVAAVPRKM